MMRLMVAGLVVALALTAARAEERRQLGAHEHGHGKLDIAIEGNTVSMMLEVPGADIVGFEHEAKTQKDKDAVAAAKKKLADALALFGPASAAGCKLASAKVEIEAEGEDHEGERHEHKKGEKKKEEVHEHEGHNEFHATYLLTCAKPAALTTLAFKYFDVFPGAQELEIQLIAPKGQSKYEATRQSPTVTLKGMQ
jgi:Protein of unknown function (DUF2796)